MKVIFLDFDGVLNSAASFLYEDRKRKSTPTSTPLNETLCFICASNFQLLLDKHPDAKIVISSTWRELFSLEWLKEKLSFYGIDSSRVIDKTCTSMSNNRGMEISRWLSEHPEVTKYVIIDDNDWGISALHGNEHFVRTEWDTGMTLHHTYEAEKKLK